MSVFEDLVALLEREQARFRVVEHESEGRSDLVAALRGTTIAQGAKAMVCEITDLSKTEPGKFVLAVVPGDCRVNFKAVARMADGRKGTFANPDRAQSLTGCVMGAVPPFVFNGPLTLFADAAFLASEDEIAFNAGRLDRSIVMKSVDYKRIARPQIGDIAVR